jgi:pimeloyl-ACP methyl ester carboxylesterase
LQKIAYTFGYGERDFFKRIHADTLVQDGTLPNARVFTVSKSAHHPYFDNPEETLEYALESFFQFETELFK